MPQYDPRTMTAADYEQAAQEYLRSLPSEHFMEATVQATQRQITTASWAGLRVVRPEVEFFNELLIQYFLKGRFRRVVPDNLMICTTEPPRDRTSYAIDLEPVPPFLVMEYISPGSVRKDYKTSFRKYERELKVPYCILFYPERQDLRVFHHNGERYEPLQPNGSGRYHVAELELEVGILTGWVRFWYQGQLLELPAELLDRVARLQQQLAAKDEELKAKDQTIREKDEQLQRVVTVLRGQVEERARRASRQDILDRLPATADTNQLTLWLVELA
jgi:hypothetical protein